MKSPCELCDEAWRGLIEEKLRTAQRLAEMTQNHDAVLRLYAHWRSRAEKAEAELLAMQSREPGSRP